MFNLSWHIYLYSKHVFDSHVLNLPHCKPVATTLLHFDLSRAHHFRMLSTRVLIIQRHVPKKKVLANVDVTLYPVDPR